MTRGRPRNPAEAADALRAAVDQTFQATFGRLATGDDVKELRDRLEKLEKRVAALEKQTRSPDAASGGRRRDRSQNRKRG